MSDIFSLMGDEYSSQRDRQARQYRENLNSQGNIFSAERDAQHAERLEGVRRRNERAQKTREQYGFDYNIDQYAALAGAIDKGIIKEDQGYDILAAQTIADNFKKQGVDIDVREIYENLPAYREYVLGGQEGQSARTPKTNLAAIHGAFVTAGASMRKNFLGMQLADARSNNNKELETIILKRLGQENEITEEYGDYQKRNFFVEAAKFAAQSSVYTAFVMAGGMLGGTPGAFMAGWAGATGQSYLGLSEAGVKHEIAYPFAIAMGAVNAVIESQLGNAAGLVGRITGAKTLQKSIAKRAAAFVSDKLHLSGAALKMATGPLANYLFENLGEVSEEVFQEISEIVGTELAAFLQKEGVQLDRGDYISRIAQAAKGGFMSSLIMGLPGLSIDTVGHLSDYQTLRVDADTIASEKAFKERNKDSPLRGDMSDEEWDKELSKIHEGRQGMRLAEEAKIAAELKETAGLGEGYAEAETDKETGEPVPLGKLYRKKSGRLYTELDEKNGLFKAGDARIESAANLDAHIKYNEDADGGITIEEFQVRPDRDTPEYRREFYRDFAENFAGHEVRWNPNTEKAVNIREDLIRNNPLGEKAGLNYYDEADTPNMGEASYRNRVIDNFKRYFPQLGNAEHAVMAAEWEHFAGLNNLSLEEYINKEFGGLDKAFTTDANRRIDAAAKEGMSIKGAVTFEDLARDAKAVIYVSTNSDLSTFIHEMGHIYRRRLSGDLLAQAGRIWGVEGGKWTTAQEEQFTEDLERWRRDGKAPTAEMETFFRKFAEFLKKIINAVSKRAEVSPEIQEFFDQLYAGEQEAGQKLDTVGQGQEGAQEAHSGQPEAKTENDTAGGSEAAAGAAQGQEELDTSGIEQIREKYQAAAKEYGDTDSINVNGSEMEGRWVITEAETPAASHDETTFNETEGFIKAGGKTINDRDYRRDKAAQEAVLSIASNYDSRALDGVVITTDGIIISGNNRTMSGKLAARQGTDGKYLAALEKKAKRYGLSEEQVKRFSHPRLLFEVDVGGNYDTALFAQFNRSTKKALDPGEFSVKMSKLVKDSTVKTIAAAVSEHETVGDLYKDKNALLDFFNTLKTDGLIGEYDMPQFFTEADGITAAGEELLENILLGSTLSEANIRTLKDSKALRQKLVRALPQLVDSRAMGEYSVIPEVNEAVRIAVEVERNGKTFKSVEEWAQQRGFSFMEQRNQVAVELAKQLEGKSQSGFADFMGGLNAVLTDASQGQKDLLSGGVESKEEIVRRFLGVKADIAEIREANNKVIADKSAPTLEKVQAALDNAGLARGEADGTLFQPAYHGSPHRFNRFDSSHMGSGEGAQSEGWGLYFASKKEVAEYYRQTLSDEYTPLSELTESEQNNILSMIKEAGLADYITERQAENIDIETLEEYINDSGNNTLYETLAGYIGSEEKINALIEKYNLKNIMPGQLYEVDIPGDEEMLDWDKKLKEQPEQVQKIINKNAEQFFNFGIGTTRDVIQFRSGEQIYRELSQKTGGDQTASQYLNSLGIKGIRYLDGSSRAAGEGSHNYVIFDDSDINITQTLFQPAYHGSPYRFDRFDSSHIGEGEGEQVYGWGHYFADKKEIAEWYRENYANTEYEYKGEQYREVIKRGQWSEELSFINAKTGEALHSKNADGGIDKQWAVLNILHNENNDKEAAKKSIEYFIYDNEIDEGEGREWENEFNEIYKEYLAILDGIQISKGQLYEADIPGDEEMLDWDKPLSEQSEKNKNAIKNIANNLDENQLADLGNDISILTNPENTGTNFYDTLISLSGIGSAKNGSKLLHDYGIKGIRYLDGSSRAAGEGSHNYVIFDDSDINITRTFFQLDGQLVEEAAGYDSWQEFRDAYEGKSRAILNGKPVAAVSSQDIPIINGEPITTAKAWIEQNPIGAVETVIGDVEITPEGIDSSFWHTRYENKVFVLPAVKPILQEGAFLSKLNDFNPETNIKNYYFAAPVELDGERKIVFVRVRQLEGDSKKFYVHEVFTEDEVRAAAPLQEEIGKRKPGDGSYAATIPGSKPDRKQSDLYRSIINNVLTVNQNARATDAWYKSLWEDARKIHKNTLFQEGEEKTTRAGELDKRFAKEADKKYLTEALKTIHGILNDKSLEPAEGEDRSGYENTQRLAGRIRRELPNSGPIRGLAAQLNSGGTLFSRQWDRLKKFIRDNPRECRSVFADVMGQEEYLEDLAEVADGEPHARLADPRTVRENNTMGRLREIGREIGDPELQRRIENGEITFDDPLITAYEQGQQYEYRKASEAIKALETEIGEDFARLANDAKRRMVKLYEDMLAAKERLTGEKDRLSRKVEGGIKTLEPYQRQEHLEQASYERAYKAFDDFAKAYGIDADVREALARRDARAEERAKQQGLNKKRRALAAIREIKRKVIRRITRNVSFETIGYDQAVAVKAIQRIFEPSIIEGVNKWIGGARGPLLREVWSQWSTDEQYREQLIDAAGEKKSGKIADILDKDWDFIITADKKALIRLLPKADFVRDLGLEELIQENDESVQLDIDERVINGQVHFILGAELERAIKDAVGEDLYNRIQNKPLGEWTLAEAEELARVVDDLTVEGRRELRAKKEARRIIEQRYRDRVLAAVKKTGIAINPDDTPEEKERKQKEINRILGKYARGDRHNTFLNNFFDANLRRFTTALDGGRTGIFTSLLYWGENDAYNKRETRIAARRALVDAARKENNISLEELYREVEIPGLEGLDMDMYRVSGGSLTVDDLLYIMRGYENEETRKAITYGNLSNARDRALYKSGRENLDDIEAFANIGHGRMMAVMSFAKDYFAKPENKKFLELAKVIGADYDRNGERMNRACIEMFNKPMWRVENYVPMNRREQTGDEHENRVIEDLMGMTGVGQKWVQRGFTIKRKYISPYDQAPIELGLYKTWADSVNNTEHLLAYGPLVQTLNAVFKGYDTGEVRQAVGDRWGRAANNRIADTIAEFANPGAGKLNTGALNSFVRSLRGKTATAYLAWKASSVLKQAVTSPWPYLQEIPPPQYLAACFEVAGGFGKVNDFIREKSIYMKNRDFDPMMKLVREQMAKNKNAIGHKIDQFNSLGMKGLSWVDWAAVAPGWLAKYRAELAAIAKEQEAEYQKLLDKYRGSDWSDILPTEESKVNRALSEIMNDEQQDYEAVARADDAVRRMQPSSRATDIAPMFKGRSELANAVLQFQVALNVIWQNIRYDLPLAVKEKQVMTVVGMVTGYALAGISVGLLLDDDDEKEKEKRNTEMWILYNSLTQFTEAVPLIGSAVTDLAESAITGKRTFRSQQNLWPVMEKAFTGIEKAAGILHEDDSEKQRSLFAKAAGNFAEAVGIGFGLPVSGVKELGKAAGIGNGDGELEFYPEAFLGRRKKRR